MFNISRAITKNLSILALSGLLNKRGNKIFLKKNNKLGQ